MLTNNKPTTSFQTEIDFEAEKLCQFFYQLSNQSDQKPSKDDLQLAKLFLSRHEEPIWAQVQLVKILEQLKITNQTPKTFIDLKDHFLN